MTSCDHSCLLSNVFAHFYIKYHMAANFLITRLELAFIILEFLKGESRVCHFLANGVPPQRITIFIVSSLFFFNQLGYPITEFMRTNPIFGLGFRNNCVSSKHTVPTRQMPDRRIFDSERSTRRLAWDMILLYL